MLIIVPYLLAAPFLIFFLGIASLVNSLIFIGPYYMSILLFIGAIVVVTGSLYSLRFMNKSNWPQVEGTITQSQVVRSPNSIFKLWTIKYTYTFTFEGINHIKNCYSKIIFTNRYDAHKYLEKISIADQHKLPVSVFKYYPDLSSINHKMNVFSLLYFYLVIIVTSQLLFIGFLAKIYINYQLPPAENTDIFVQLQNIISIYFSKLDVTLLILPILILILLLIFILKSIWLIIQNKLYIFNSRITPILETPAIQKDQLTQRICVHCHQKNDLDSTFCLNCGRMLIS